MIVTCPSCSAKYRVRDEAVPSGGAELQCPSCSALFVAHPPKHTDHELTAAIERLTAARDSAEARSGELERARTESEHRAAEHEQRTAELGRRAAENELRALAAERKAAELETRLLQADKGHADDEKRALDAELRITEGERALLEADRKLTDAEKRLVDVERNGPDRDRRDVEADRRVSDATKRVTAAESRAQKLEAELAARVSGADQREQAREAELARLREELLRAPSRARGTDVEGNSVEVARARDELANAQKTAGRLYAELEAAQQTIGRLKDDLRAANDKPSTPHSPFASTNGVGAAKAVEQLQAEVARLRDQLAAAVGMSDEGPPVRGTNLQALIAAVGPMLWGLEQCIKYLEPFTTGEPALAGHVRQLQLLCGVLTRLHRESAAA